MPIARFQMPDGRIARFDVPEGTTPDEATAMMEQHFAAATPAPKTPSEEKPGSAFGRGLSRSVDITQQGLGSALEGIGRSTGFSGLEQYGAGVAARNTKELQDAEENATRRQDVEGVGTGLSYAGEALGESAVPMGIGIGAGALAAGTVGAALGSVIPGPGTLAGGLIGLGVGAAGAALSQIPLFYGWNRERQKDAVQQGIIPEVSESAAFLTAIPQAALEGIADRILPGGGKFITKAGAGLFTRLSAGAGTGIVTEVPTEIGQQVLERAQAGLSLDDEEAMQEYLDAGVGAGVIGGGIGGASGAFRGRGATKEKTGEEEGDKTEIPDPFAGLPKNVKAEAVRLQEATGISAEEAVARAQEEINGLEQANQRPAGDVGDVGLEPSVPPTGGQNVNAGVADPATGAAGAGLGVPSGAAQQAGNGAVGEQGSLDQIIAQQPSAAGEALAREFPKVPVDQTAVEPVKNVINQVADAPPIKGIPKAAPELPLMQYADEANADNAKLDNEIAFFEGRDKENQAAEQAALVAEQATFTAPTLTLDPSTPKKSRTTQAVEAVKAVAAMDAFKGIEVAKKDINQAAQRLVNNNGGDPYVSLTRVLEGEPAVPKKVKAKVAEEVPFEGAPEVVAPKAAAPTVVKGAEPKIAPKIEAAPDLFSADVNPEAEPYVRAEAAKETVPPEMTNFPAKREAAPYIEPTTTLEPTKKTGKDKGRVYNVEPAKTPNYPQAMILARMALKDKNITQAEFDLIDKQAKEESVPPENLGGAVNALVKINKDNRARGPQGITAARAKEMGDPSYRSLQRAEGETDAAEGMFSPLERLIRVALDSKGRLETLHHEAIHAMRDMGLFKDPEWAALSKRAKDEWIAKYEIKKKYKDDNLTEEQEIEEAVAEAYADYVANKNQGGKTKTLFDRMRNLLRAVMDAIRGAPEDVFRRIEKGEIGRRERKTTTGDGAKTPMVKGTERYTRGRDAERAQVENSLRRRLDELGLSDVALKVPDSMTVERGEKGVSLQRSKAGEDAAKANNKITDANDEWADDDATADSTTEALGESIKGHDPEAYVGGLDAALNYTGPKLLEKLLSALPGSTIIKWGSKYIKKHLTELRSLVDTMVAERANMLRAAGKISVKYLKFVNAHGQKALSAVMAKARILNVNPTEFANVTEALKNDAVIKHLEGLIATTKSPGLHNVLMAELAEREGHIKEVHKLWDELGKQEGGHALYKEVRQYYKDMYAILRSRWLENAKSQVKGEENKKALEASLKAIEDEVQTADPDYYHGAPKPKIIDQYFPFKRFGRYSLRMEADAAEGTARYYERFDSVAQRDAKIAEIAKKRGVSPKSKIFKLKIEKDEDSYDSKNVSKTVQSMYDTIDKSQVLGGDLDATKMELKRQLNEILLSNLPARSLGKNQMRAENVEGYSMDFFRVFNTSATGYANQLPRIKYAPKIRAVIKEASLYAENNYSGEVAEKLQLLINELETRAEEAITPPKRGAIAVAINRFAYVWLLSSAASAATQMTSLPIRVLPALGSRYGYGKATAKLALFSNVFKSVGYTVTHEDGSKTYTWPSMDLSPMVTSNPLRKKFFKALQDRGVFNDAPTEAITQMGATPENVKLTGEGAMAQAGAMTDKAFGAMTAGFTSAEQITRQIAGLARAELAYETKKAAAAKAGVKFDEAKAFDAAVDEAVQGNRDALGDYSEFERPRIINADFARFVFQFKNYAVTTTKFFLENTHAMFKGETPEVRAQAMKELAGVLTMGSMFFGVTGLPLYSVVTATIDAVLDNLEDDEDKRKRRGKNPLTADDSDQRFRRDFLPQHFGNITIPGITGDKVSLSAMIESGPISAWTDMNWSRRTQFNNLWFQQGMKGATFEESAKNAILANLGPAVSLGDNFARAVDDFSNGEITRGLIKLNPAFSKGIFNAYQLGTEGATTTKGDVILGPASFGTYNLVNSVLGLQSDRLARLQNEKFARTGEKVKQEREKSKLLSRYTDLSSHAGSEPEDFKALFSKIKEYNQRYPLPNMQVDMDNLAASLAASMQKRQFSLYGSYFTPEQLYYELESVISAAPPK